uniref:F-box only protein 25 n=1 Tax=Rhinolophus ferrumequinum TaxID=59479 RepID=A0A671EIV5_RHIFE
MRLHLPLKCHLLHRGTSFVRTMPFLGQDWRSPGWSWIKTEDGWKRCESWSQELERENNQRNFDHSVILNSDDEEIFSNEEHGYASKKRKKGHFRNDTNTQCFYREKWIYVHKESTRERHGYCTLGEAFNRLDFSSAIQDVRRFNYVVKLLQLIAKSQLTSLSGVAQKNYFNILDKIVQKVLHDQQNPRLIKGLLHDLGSTLCVLIRGVGKSVLVGNINVWVCRLETVLAWQQQLQNLQMPQQVGQSLTLSDLPLHTLNSILYRLSDGWDIVTLGQVTPALRMLSEDRRLWKALCQYHFAEKQVSPRCRKGCPHLATSGAGFPGVPLQNQKCSELIRSAHGFSSTAGKADVSCSRTPVPNTAQSRRARFFSSVGGISSPQFADSQHGVCPLVRLPFAPRLLWSGARGGCPVPVLPVPPCAPPVLVWDQQRAARSRSSTEPCGCAHAQPGCCAPSQRGAGHVRVLRANSG